MKVLKAEILNEIADIREYFINYFFGWINYLLLILGIYYGSGLNKSDQLDKTMYLLGIAVWLLTSYAIMSVSIIIQDAKRQGTLEQLFMTRSNFLSIVFTKLTAWIFSEILQIILMISVASLIMRMDFTISIGILDVVLRFIILIVGLYGLSLLVAGFSIIYKKAQAVARATTNFILFFSGLIIPISRIPRVFVIISKAFPFNYYISSLRYKYIDGNVQMGNRELMIMTMLSMLWFVIGISVFKLSINKAKNEGTISQY